MNGSIRIGNLFGIPFFVNVSWFIVLALMTINYGGSLGAQFPQLGIIGAFSLGLIASLLLFASVLAHELGHSFVAIRQGIDVKSITLFLFGGLASLDKEAKTPGGAFSIAIAGPAVSLVLFAAFSLLSASNLVAGAAGAIIGLLAYINLALGVFNLIPGLPLDGGNVLKAAVWKLTGNPHKGVLFASRVGQGIGWLGIGIGLLPVFLTGSFPNIWTILIGLFLLRNAKALTFDAKLRSQLSQWTAADAITADSPIASEELSLRELANEYLIGHPNIHRVFVTNSQGQWVGQLKVSQTRQVPTSQWPLVMVKELMQPIDEMMTVDAEQSLLDVVTLLEKEQINEVPVVREGTILGLIEKASIRQLLQRQAQVQPA
ncbi:MAG: site-2 protease family protein [Microcoleaceae cyanobacterium]